jgi:hypothetical protein
VFRRNINRYLTTASPIVTVLPPPGRHLREAEIQDLRLAAKRNKYIRRFNIPMDDTSRVCRG